MNLRLLLVLGAWPCQLWAHDVPQGEARMSHAIGLTPDGTHLLALNASEGRLSVFDITHSDVAPLPRLIQEIPVGLEPVSLKARTNDEVWVVNEFSDSISIVSLEKSATVATLQVPDEPADVVFAGGKAYVCCARNHLLRVFQAHSRQELASIPLPGRFPHAMAVSTDATRLFVAYLLSGNNTAVLSPAQAPSPPAPTNPNLPPAPQTGLIVAGNDPRLGFTVPGSSTTMRGPRSLVLDAPGQRLFSLNKISNTISIINTQTGQLAGEMPTGAFEPMPADINSARSLFFDARHSGNGLVSCGVCHLDADHDGLAWDLGDPSGEMVLARGKNLAAGDPTVRERPLHPMKGPMLTRSLRGLHRVYPYNARGDQNYGLSFEKKFRDLLGSSVSETEGFLYLQNFFYSTLPAPNPHRTLANQLPGNFAGVNPARGQTLFQAPSSKCVVCHVGEIGASNNIDDFLLIGGTQYFKNAALGSLYQRENFLHDGTASVLPLAHPVTGSTLTNVVDLADAAAYLQCFDSGSAPALGHTVTLNAVTKGNASLLAEISTLEQQVSRGAIDLVVQGRAGGISRSFVFDASANQYRTDLFDPYQVGRVDILNLLQGDAVLSWLGVYTTLGLNRGGDRDGDGYPDSEEPLPRLTPEKQGLNQLRLTWSTSEPDWYLESLTGAAWQPVPLSVVRGATSSHSSLEMLAPHQLFRLRRTW